jgi:hypothetical protein
MLCQRQLNLYRSFLTSTLLLAATAAPALATPVHVTDAESLLADLLVSKQNVYGTDPSYIVWSGNSSQARTECATFVTNLLLHAYNWTNNTFTQWMGSTSPYAQTYYAAIVAQNRFTEISSIAEMQPGDIIAIKYNNDSSSTGHAMLVDAVAQAENQMSPVIAGTTQYEVTIIDSTSTPHGGNDTRTNNGSTTGTGIGRGDIRVYVNATLQPVGYSWSNQSGSEYYDMAQRPLAIGRINLASFGVNPPPMNNGGNANGGGSSQTPPPPVGDDTGTPMGQPTNPGTDTAVAQMGGCSFTGSEEAELASPGAVGLLLLFFSMVGILYSRRIAHG